jgi:hypothetical protein
MPSLAKTSTPIGAWLRNLLARELERRVRELERLLGRKTMEVEILKRLMSRG